MKVIFTSNTYEVKEQLKTLGARWNSAERGWEFSDQEAAYQAAKLIGNIAAMRAYDAVYGVDAYADRFEDERRAEQVARETPAAGPAAEDVRVVTTDAGVVEVGAKSSRGFTHIAIVPSKDLRRRNGEGLEIFAEGVRYEGTAETMRIEGSPAVRMNIRGWTFYSTSPELYAAVGAEES